MNKVENGMYKEYDCKKVPGLISERKMYGGVSVHFNERLHMLQSGFRFNKVHQFGKRRQLLKSW